MFSRDLHKFNCIRQRTKVKKILSPRRLKWMEKGWKGTRFTVEKFTDPLINYRKAFSLIFYSACQSWSLRFSTDTVENRSLQHFWEVTQFWKAARLVPFTTRVLNENALHVAKKQKIIKSTRFFVSFLQLTFVYIANSFSSLMCLTSIFFFLSLRLVFYFMCFVLSNGTSIILCCYFSSLFSRLVFIALTFLRSELIGLIDSLVEAEKNGKITIQSSPS